MAGALFGEVEVSLFAANAFLAKFKCPFSWHVHYLVKFKCPFSWQAADYGRIMLGSWSDRPRIVNDISASSENFSDILECHFSWQA